MVGFGHVGQVMAGLAMDLLRFLGANLRSRTALAAENLFLRKQLALYRERQGKPRRASDSLRLTLVREALTIVQPATLLRWHREAFRLFWRWRSRPWTPTAPGRAQRVIAAMARDNVTWGEERIAAELLLKLGIRASPRTVRRYMGRRVAVEERHSARPGSAGQRSCGITRRRSWPATSVSW
jgi:putative transposase